MNLILIDFLVFFFAWFFQGFTGFGAGIFIVGILSLYYDPKTVIVSSALANLTGTLLILFILLRSSKPEFKILLFLISGSIPGIVLGTEILLISERELLKFIIGTFILFLGIFDLLVQKKYLKKLKLKRSVFNSLFSGFLGGLFAGLVGMGGPPPVVYLNQVIEDIGKFKTTLNLFFTSNIVIRLLSYASLGGIEYFSLELIKVSLISVPLGTVLGLYMSKNMSTESFKKIVSLSVIFLGFILILESLNSY